MNGFLRQLSDSAGTLCDWLRWISRKGLGNSTQKITTIPEAQNDMIFSIICEELGIFGALVLLLLWLLAVPSVCGCTECAGRVWNADGERRFAHISIQVILNLCVVLKLMPATELPFHLSVTEEHRCSFILTEIGIALCVSRFIVFQDGKSGEGEAQAEEQ